MNRRAALYLVVVFVLGVALGGVATYWADQRNLVRWHERGRSYSVQNRVEWLTRELELSAAQQEQLRGILENTGQQYGRIRERMHGEYDQVRQAGRHRIRQILTQEQRPRFEELLRQIDAERRQRAERHQEKSRPKETR